MKLSIITINYNNHDGLQRTIDSVVSQTWHDFEWIVIDGGSTDGSKELIEKYNYCFSFWCSEPDNGIYNAMNKGILKSKGEYLNFLNSGDVYSTPTILHEIFSCTHEADILYGYMMRKTIDGIVNNASMMKNELMWYNFYDDTLPHQSSFIKKSLFDKYGLYDETYQALADWKFFIYAIIYHMASYEFIPQKISIYECGGISDDNLGLIERDRLREEMFPQMIMRDLPMIIFINRLKRNRLCRIAFSIYRRIASLGKKSLYNDFVIF